MTQEKDLCPTSDTGYHRYFIFKVIEVFEPLVLGFFTGKKEDERTVVFEKVEYAISGCNCGSSIKQRVKQQ